MRIFGRATQRWTSQLGRLALASTLVWALPSTWATHQDEPETDDPSSSYLKAVEVDETTMRLDVHVKRFVPRNGKGPSIALAGAVHIAEASFYEEMQTYLDAQDLVLYEQVQPRNVGALEDGDDETRAARTEATIRFVAVMVEQYKSSEGTYPESLDDVAAWVEANAKSRAEWFASSLVDGWGRPLMYMPTERKFDVVSYGADGREGGDDFNADLAFSDQKKLSKAETGADPGIQSRMAKALGLSFQLEAMTHDREHYRNSDMTIDEVEAAVAARGGDADVLFSVLDGSSITGWFLKFALNMIERVPQMQAMIKVVLVETLANAEDGFADMQGMGPDMAALLDAIIIDRNLVVIEDLKDILENEADEHETIAIIYGAGHLRDLEERMLDTFDYEYKDGFWLSAISADLSEAGMTRNDIKMMRRMMERMQNVK